MLRTAVSGAAPAAIVLALALSGCGSSEPAVGKCTNMNPDLGVELDVKIVDCGDSDASTKIVKEAKNRVDCDTGTLTFGDKIFCTEPLKK